MKKYLRFFLLMSLFTALLTACGGGVNVDELLAESATTMASVDTVSFILTLEGDAVLLDPSQGIIMQSAEGQFSASDGVYAQVNVGLAIAEVVWNNAGVYYKVPPLIPDYQPLEISGGFNPGDIFGTEIGLPHIMTDVLENADLEGEEDLDGIPSYHITATASSDAVGEMVGGLVEGTEVTVDIWIDKETNEIVRVQIVESETRTWILDLFGYGDAVEIPAP